MDLLTTDLCDAGEDKVRVVEPMFSSFGGRAAFFGRIATLKLFEDNSLVRKALGSPGESRVLVIDGVVISTTALHNSCIRYISKQP